MSNLLFVMAAIALGACVSLQPPINVVMARTLGSPWLAVTISIGISLVLALGMWLTWGAGAGDLERVQALPWWVVIGGTVGVLFVLGGIAVAPVLGIALFFVCVVAGQLFASTIIDHVGAFGAQVKPINSLKLVGLFLVVVGAILVRKGGA